MHRRAVLTGLSALVAMAAGEAHAQLAALPRADRVLVEQAAAYLQTLKTAKGRFIQTNSRGQATTGMLYLNRPGRARFEYDAPAQMLVVADGKKVSVYDRRLKSLDSYPLGATPLGIFLSRRIRLDDQDVRVARVTRAETGFSVTLTDPQGQADGRLVLEFTEAPLALSGWTVVDGQGVQTRVKLQGLSLVSGLDPALFVMDAAKG